MNRPILAASRRRPATTTPTVAGRRARTRGQSLVEFAVVLPIFLLILCGIFDFGFALYSRMSVINAAREGARAASVAPDHTTISSTAQDSAAAAAQGSGLTVPTSGVSVSCVPNPPVTAPCDFAAQGDAKAGDDSVSVTVNYSYKSFFPFLFGSSFNLSSTVQMVIEQ
jgi:Flp pilus assembly protein TadG